MSAKCQEKQFIVHKEFIKVYGVDTLVLKLGGQGNNTPKRQRVIILIIPGNPGVPYFYEDFMQELFDQGQGQTPVWCISQAGHVRPPGEALTISHVYSAPEATFGLEAQIQHKAEFIKHHIPHEVSVILVGHSIGCYMALNLLDLLPNDKVLHCFFLFPTLERMAVTPNGKFLTPILRHLRWIAVIAAATFSVFPKKYQVKLIQWWFQGSGHPECAQGAILETATPWTANFATFLAKLEMNAVTGLQKDLIVKHMNRLSLYYGACDHWCPVEYYQDLVREFPKVDARLCQLNMKHAFVLDSQEGRHMAHIVWEWIQVHSDKLLCSESSETQLRATS